MNNLINIIIEHYILSIILIISIIIYITYEIIETIISQKSINVNEAIRIINNKNALIIDFRKKSLYEKSYIINSINIPEDEIEKNKKILKNYNNNPIIIIHENNYKSIKIIKKLANIDINNTIYIYDGIDSWKKNELPTKKIQ